MTVMINDYQVELRNSGSSTCWCVYTKRTPRRNSGSNLVLQIPASKTGVSLLLSKSQQVNKLVSIIRRSLPC